MLILCKIYLLLLLFNDLLVVTFIFKNRGCWIYISYHINGKTLLKTLLSVQVSYNKNAIIICLFFYLKDCLNSYSKCVIQRAVMAVFLQTLKSEACTKGYKCCCLTASRKKRISNIKIKEVLT